MAGSVKVVLKSVFDDKGIKSAQAEFANVGKTIGGVLTAVGASVALAGAGIAKFGADSVKSASTLEESLNAVNVAYGSASKAIVELGEDAAQRLGVTQSAFNAAAVRFSAFAERVVGAGGDVTGFIDDITTRAADFASVFNIDVAEALQVFQSGLSGEAEPLKRFGINLLDSEVKAYGLRTGLIAVGETMTEQQKVQARYGLLMEATAKTQGDFANTSDSLANSQRILQASFEDLQASVGSALLPVFADLTKEFGTMLPSIQAALIPAAEALAETFRTKVVPIIQRFTEWLASPEGTKKVEEFTKAILDGVIGFVKFTAEILENFDAVKNTLITLGAAIITFNTLRTALQLATAAQLLFNAAVSANPYVLAATALATLISLAVAAGSAMAAFAEEQKAAREASTGLAGRLGELVAEQRRLKELFDNGVISFADYKKAIGPVNSELAILQGNMMRAAGAGRDLNKVSIGSLTGQLSAAAGEANRFRAILAGIPTSTVVTAVTETGAGKPKGKTAAEIRAEQVEAAEKAFEKVQKLVRATQKKIVEAQEGYDKAVTRANADYLENVAKLRTDYANALEGIVKTSQDRLRSAFQTAVGASLSDLFGKEGERSVEKLVENLRNRIIASRQLIQNSSQLASLGFTQTFIEQVVSAGVETGNELADAILKSTPETQAQLKGLFTALEQTGETGMDGLAKTIYDQQGLATRELRDLYKKTGEELDKALLDQQVRFQETLKAAAESLGEKLRDIKTDFEEDVADLKGAYGGLKGVIDGVSNSLDSMIGKADQAAKAASDAAIKAANSTRAAVADITGKPMAGTDLGLGGSGASEGLRGFGDPLEMRRLAAIQAAGEALGTFSQQFVNTVLGQRSFVNDGQRTVLSPGASESRVGELIAKGFKEEIAAGIGGDRMNLALALAEQIYGVDIGGISTPGQVGGNTFNISVNAGMGTDPISVGAQIVEAIKRYERSSGQVFAGV